MKHLETRSTILYSISVSLWQSPIRICVDFQAIQCTTRDLKNQGTPDEKQISLAIRTALFWGLLRAEPIKQRPKRGASAQYYNTCFFFSRFDFGAVAFQDLQVNVQSIGHKIWCAAPTYICMAMLWVIIQVQTEFDTWRTEWRQLHTCTPKVKTVTFFNISTRNAFQIFA